jgi:hypothetical protein
MKTFLAFLFGFFPFILLAVLFLGIPIFGFLYELVTGEMHSVFVNATFGDLFRIAFKFSIPLDVVIALAMSVEDAMSAEESGVRKKTASSVPLWWWWVLGLIVIILVIIGMLNQ